MFIFVIDSHYIKKTPHFPEIENAIKEAVNEFEGALFPKLNWSAPRVNNKTTLFISHKKIDYTYIRMRHGLQVHRH